MERCNALQQVRGRHVHSLVLEAGGLCELIVDDDGAGATQALASFFPLGFLLKHLDVVSCSLLVPTRLLRLYTSLKSLLGGDAAGQSGYEKYGRSPGDPVTQ